MKKVESKLKHLGRYHDMTFTILALVIISADNLIAMDDFDGEENDAIEHDMVKEPGHNSAVNSMKFMDEVLNGPNANCCENFRMDKKLFYKLCNILQAKGLLHHTNRIKIEEQLAIFLYTVGHNQRTRAVQERFQYSGETISRHFNNVLNAILVLSLDYFLPPGPATPQEILEDPRFYPYFKDCIGAVDCTHIPVMVGVDEQGPFRNRSGFLSQNVLTACTFDLRFQYVLAGWEGSATDFRVLSAALTRHNKLSVPEGKYYLVDIEHANMPGFLAPYHDACCDSSEFKVDYRPQNAKELFNYRHSLLRNVIERTLKVWRARFPVLMAAPPYPLQTQVKLVVATCILHNYIRTEKSNDWLFSMYDQERQQKIKTTKAETEPATRAESLRAVHFPYEAIDLQVASELRDAVAAEMWNDHMHDL